MLPDHRRLGALERRTITALAALLAVLALHFVSPPPAKADVCSVPGVSLLCGAASGIADGVSWTWNKATGVVSGVYQGGKWALNTTTGVISSGNKLVGKIVNGVGGLTCKAIGTVGEGWWGKVCSAAKTVLGKLGSVAAKVKSKLPSGTAGTAGQVGAGGGITLAGITGWVGAGAVWMLHKSASVIGSTTEPNVHAPFFEREYKRMIELAALLALPMLLLAVIEGLLRSNWEILQRALLAVPTAFLITAMAVVLVGIGVTLSDLMGQSVASGAQADAKKFFDHAAIVLGVLLAVGGAAGHLLAGHAPAAAHVIKGAPLFIIAVGSLYAFLAAGLVLLEFVHAGGGDLRDVVVRADRDGREDLAAFGALGAGVDAGVGGVDLVEVRDRRDLGVRGGGRVELASDGAADRVRTSHGGGDLAGGVVRGRPVC